MASLSVAVVGLGYGRAHVTALEGLRGRAELVGVVDPVAPGDNPTLADAPQREAILAVGHYSTLGDLLAERVPDIVAIATPIHTHLALAREALTAGANVLLEKPPTATMAEFEELLRLGESRAVQIGFQARGGGGVAAVREAIADGAIGQVRGIGVVGLWERSRAYYARARWAGHRVLDGVTVMDGVVTNPLAHAIDTALTIAGATRSEDVSRVRIDAWHAHGIETDDTSAVVITTTAGDTIAAGLTLCAEPTPGFEPAAITVHGSAGSLELHYIADRLVQRDGTGAVVAETQFARQGLLENLVEHLSEGTPLLAPVSDTGAFMRVLEAARTGAAPRAIAPEFVTWVGEGMAAHPVVTGINGWCERVAAEGATFTELGAPWTR